MLRITHVENPTCGPTIKLEGKLLEAWTSEVRRVCASLPETSSRRRLDLAALTFVDGEGAKLLAELAADGVELANCCQFIATLLQKEAKT